MRTERYELRDDPCAAGKWRGGIGMVRVNRFLVDTIVTCEGDRYESDPPWGIFGGQDGTLAHGKVTTPDGTVEHWPAKFTGKVLQAGSTIEIAVPNSGGYGDPLERDSGARPLRRARRLHDRSSSPSELRRRDRSPRRWPSTPRQRDACAAKRSHSSLPRLEDLPGASVNVAPAIRSR